MPDLVVMAVVALLAEAPGVRIIGLVAAVAVFRNLVLVVAAPVAAEAVDLGVAPEQRKAGLLLVIELGGLPLGRGVALAAVITTLFIVRIVGRMTADAALGCLFIVATKVTGAAADALVRAGERELGLAVIEARARPAVEVVAIGAAIAQLALALR
jgi:hypothetical protein